jgi:uncharacterized protein YbjT (DUF2867 family)
VSWVGREEIAEAAVKQLASDTPLLGTLPMTGPAAVSLALLFDGTFDAIILVGEG